jgi:CubicO group peptidase (beta-lactamase class C family)
MRAVRITTLKHKIIVPFLLCLMTSAATHAAQETALNRRINRLFADYTGPGKPGAAVMVIHKSKVLHARGYGLADVDKGIPVDTNTNFRLASVTKQFTALCVLMLIERNQLSLDDALSQHLPEFPAYGREITIRQLLNHTSGLLDYEDLISSNTTLPVLDQNVLQLMLNTDRTYFPPGTSYRYSNTAYALLAMIVEKVSGQTFASFLRKNIFEPLGMNHTLAYEEGLSMIPNRAYGHSNKDGRFVRADQSITSSVLGDGGIYSSVADLFKWDQSLYTTNLVNADTLQLASTPGPDTEKPDTRYGFGWYMSEYRGLRKIWHTGSTIGFRNRLERFPDQEFTVIILTNRGAPDPQTIAEQIVDLCLSPDSK